MPGTACRVCNPDGFVRSREWYPVAQSSLVWSTGVDLGLIVYEDGPGKRRNLRDNGSGTDGVLQNDVGVDTNRNYPLMWGGVGASASPTVQTYHGPSPASEPEVEAMMSLLRRTQLIAGISNHTSGNLMLRPWGFIPDDTPDEALPTDLGAATHVVVRGQAPAGTTLRLRKDVEYLYSAIDPESGEDIVVDRIEAAMVVGADGTFAWHMNPSESRYNLQEFGGSGELYVLKATLPDGSSRGVEVGAERGQVVEVDI